MRVRSIMCGIFIAAASAMAPASIAQETRPPAEAQVNAEAKRLAQGLIEETLRTAHVAEI